nr:MAG TPA: hypothetical protein [Caudoviricetes sp.]
MKKYKVLESIGSVLLGVGFICLVLVLAIQVDTKPDTIFLILRWLAGSIAIIGVSAMLINWMQVEAFLISALIFVGASMYRICRRPRKMLRRCYKMKKSLHTFNNCRKEYTEYTEYMESLYNTEDVENKLWR